MLALVWLLACGAAPEAVLPDRADDGEAAADTSAAEGDTDCPIAGEFCDAERRDEDCDGLADDDDLEGAMGKTWWYRDADGDGHGRPDAAVWRCHPPPGHVAEPGDCDDHAPEVHPGATDPCPFDDLDQACVGTVPWFLDGDGDGFGEIVTDCRGPMVPAGGDCDDADPTRHPGATEVCADGVDQDCDGIAGPCGVGGDYDLYGPAVQVAGRVAASGDVDGDGFTDLLTGAHHHWHSPPPRVHRGPFLASAAEDDAWLVVDGAGYVTSGGTLADVDGDGQHDLVVHTGIGAWVAIEPPSGVYVDTAAPLVFAPGLLRSLVVDADGDGDDEIALDHGFTDGHSNGVTLVSARGSGVVDPRTVAVATVHGNLLQSAGDIDGDGFDDLVWAADGDVVLLQGPFEGVLGRDDADVLLAGDLDADWVVPFAAGDLDGDGRDDLGVTAHPRWLASDECGAADHMVHLHLAPSSGTIVDADATLASNRRLGDLAGPAGDLDGDGRGELLLAASCPETHPPKAFVVSGPYAGRMDLDAHIVASIVFPNDEQPQTVLSDDLNGDGLPDLAIGAETTSILLFGGPGL